MEDKTEYTNRMSIQRENSCEKCKFMSFDHKFYNEGDRIFYCCDSCAKKLNLITLDDLMNKI